MGNKVTILIPTMDRPEYLLKALRYYAKLKFTGPILIGDSSEPEHAAKIKNWISANASLLTVKYHHCSKSEYCHDGMVMKKLSSEMETEYGVFSGDDDFLVPGALHESAEFLDEHPEFVAASGHRVAFTLDSPCPSGNVVKTEYVTQPDLSDESPAIRWKNYMNLSISNQYHVQKADVLKKAYYQCDKAKLRYIGPELMPCSISTISGKTAYINKISCFFQINPLQIFNCNSKTMYHLIMSPEWSESAITLKNSVINQLEKAGININDAEKLFEKEFWDHIRRRLNWQFRDHYLKESKIKQLAKKIHGLLEFVCSKEKSHFARKEKNAKTVFSLKKLRDQKSPYHADFKIIEEVLAR